MVWPSAYPRSVPHGLVIGLRFSISPLFTRWGDQFCRDIELELVIIKPFLPALLSLLHGPELSYPAMRRTTRRWSPTGRYKRPKFTRVVSLPPRAAKMSLWPSLYSTLEVRFSLVTVSLLPGSGW